MKMLAAVTPAMSAAFELREVELEDPRPGEVLVRIAATGVCHTDLSCRDQYYPVPLPAVLGHEGAGVVERVGAGVTKVAPGDKVVLTYFYCGACPACSVGRQTYCDHAFGGNFGGARLDGTSPLSSADGPLHGAFFHQSSFAQYALAVERNVVRLRDDAPLDLLGPLGCGIQTGAGAVLNALRPSPGQSIAVFGTGSVGLAAVMAARLAGCDPIVAIDVQPSRLAVARELGATHAVDPRSVDPVEAIRTATAGRGADFSIETAAKPAVLRQAVDCLDALGVCGLIGATPMGTEVALDMNTVLFGRTLRGIILGDSPADVFIPRLVDFMMDGRFPLERLITHYDFADINAAVADAEAGRAIKPVLRMPQAA